MFLEQCGESCRYFQASSCYDGIDDEVLAELANPVARDEDGKPDPEGKKPSRCLEFIDISYCKQVTDAGLMAFEGKTYPLTHLCLNGLTEVTGNGLYHPIYAARDTLEVYQGALMDQEGLANSHFGKALGLCFKLNTLDLGGCRHIGDDFFNFLCSGEKMEDGLIVKPGLANLVTIKLNFLVKMFDGSVTRLAQMATSLEHLELTGCEQLTEYGLEALFKNFKNIMFFDINHIPVVNAAFFEVLKNTRPDVMVRRYQFNDIDLKDNMLRVPLRIVSKDKKKKGKKKKKK